jgi:uncharacterized protein (TIGR02118 family)
MIRAFVLYDEAPDAERYAEHVVLCEQVPGATFRHGSVFGAAMGDPPHAYYAEFEFPDKDAFKAALSSPEFAATGADAMKLGKRFSVEFVEL